MTVPKHHQWWKKASFSSNDNFPSSDDDDENVDNSDNNNDEDDFYWTELNKLPKSFSTPTFASLNKQRSACIGRSVSNYAASCSASASDECRWRKTTFLEQRLEETLSKKSKKLDDETRLMLFKAKQAARMQMVIEKGNATRMKKSTSANIEELIGLPIEGKKLTRKELIKMSASQLLVIRHQLHGDIECFNEDLVSILMEKDELIAEQDSLHLSIENLLQ